MKIKSIVILLLAGILLTACAADELSPPEIEATAEVVAATYVAETLEAMPTETLVPSPTPEPTETSPPLPTPTTIPTETLVPTATEFVPSPTPTMVQITLTPTPFVAAWKVAPLKFINNSGEQVLFIFTNPEYIEYRIDKILKEEIYYGTWYYVAYIGDEGPYRGTFVVQNIDKHEIVIEKDKIRIIRP